ncbi:MAG: hypothetical protein HY584_02325 [Candidatus Omnitrophica bacterium]|nr:hypothetical protein [Candidatus Omnitrophota bacterium]
MNRKSYKRLLLVVLGLVFVSCGSLVLFKGFQIVDAKYPWLWMYLADQARFGKDEPVSRPKHILFLYVDHFEPHDQETMSRWMEGYPEMAKKHEDADGKLPQHSFFWFFSRSDGVEKRSFLKQLAQLVYEGYGEIELHMHHGNDTEETFLKQMNEAIQLSKEVGAFVTQEVQPRTTFGFIHGMWGLDNSRGAGVCGITNELILLRKLGCYADFTNPSWGPMHPRIINRFYYATDDPNQPKSYDRGPEMEVGRPGVGDLFMFTGQSGLRLNSIVPRYDHGEIDHEHPASEERMDQWIKNAVVIKGQPEWLFIKVFSHGAMLEDHGVMLGTQADQMRTYLESQYNDGVNYVLHYVTAREAYNIAKAAEAGKTGDPSQYRDFMIAPPANRFFWASQPYELISFDEGKVILKFLSDAGREVRIRLRAKAVSLSGDAILKKVDQKEDESILTLILQDQGVVGLSFKTVIGEKGGDRFLR